LINDLIDKFSLVAKQEAHTNLYALNRDMADAPQEAKIPRKSELSMSESAKPRSRVLLIDQAAGGPGKYCKPQSGLGQ
jgi:hypothetical protein